ncbi:hypothetical protein DI53_3781 [Sphingobacterium deserti]|uniref:DUF4296 domain-containing protein n=2 Tax=Sphingobacterium deserti TaxID=1229276 RepID=A0A0B8T165_9SPHI|nr:hypothetical protein DI53_3781 [Sphingobacterium deserti]
MRFRKFVQTYEMQRLLLIILSSFFLLISCKKSAPEGILSEKKMADLMADVHLLDGYLNMLPIDSSRKIIDGLYAEVFDKYGIDSTLFTRNLRYYLGNPTMAKQVYAQVNTKLSGLDRTYRTNDSLANARLSDSVRIAQRFVRLRNEAQQLLFRVDKDTTALTYRNYSNEFIRRTGLSIQVFQQEGIPVSDPVPLQEAGVRQPAEVSAEPVEPKKMPPVSTPVDARQLPADRRQDTLSTVN